MGIQIPQVNFVAGVQIRINVLVQVDLFKVQDQDGVLHQKVVVVHNQHLLHPLLHHIVVKMILVHMRDHHLQDST